MDIQSCIRERAYLLWEREGRPDGRHIDHWLQAERELLAVSALEFEFGQLMRAYRSGIVNDGTVEEVMAELEERALANPLRGR